ncbi:nucleotidyltransferase domain-containing protein [Xenorhabdus bovienii]|uniref:Nucleotidyltransferase n=1 Tax=Xenorhabdus bovienii str. kraussei Becker Underwood TaxID=1398204 RepID=A0A077PGY3_XENBV|nr:nucleotidyltransferase [Xenorhabdus bovienii]CDH23575.1 hypothetical protein XBKB1_1880001 [Xenorhabdus bovienii str. kraussei Becker Underwood]
MNNQHTKRNSWEYFLLRAARAISLTEPQYSKIDDRYSQLQRILSALDTPPLLEGAHIFPQGSMRLRTTINPVPDAPADLGTIDADAIVWLPNAAGVEAETILAAIEKRFQEGSRVQQSIQQLRRGIRIVYADQNPGFHIDVTPARAIGSNNQTEGQGKLEVPDREHGWKASSPIPYSDWLQEASKQQFRIIEEAFSLNKSIRAADSATQAPLPEYVEYQNDDPLRAAIKLLKRHRDEWAIRTKNEEVRPISAVITTLATHAWLNVVKQSQQCPLTPLEAITEIVRQLPDAIRRDQRGFLVCNPKDNGENFAEKWNRPGEGISYYRAFLKWHESAWDAVNLGLQDYDSTDAFADAIKANFGIGRTFIDEVNSNIPSGWTMPGRPEGVTRNTASMGALFGTATGGSDSQASVKPVGRLG